MLGASALQETAVDQTLLDSGLAYLEQIRESRPDYGLCLSRLQCRGLETLSSCALITRQRRWEASAGVPRSEETPTPVGSP